MTPFILAAAIISTLSPSSQYVEIAQPATFELQATNTTAAVLSTCAPTVPLGFENSGFLPIPFIGQFSYTAYNPTTNQFIATTNSPVPIQPGETMAFEVTFVPFVSEFIGELQIPITCAGGITTPQVINTNTMYFGAYPWNPPNIIMETSQGITPLMVPRSGFTAFSISAINIGLGESLIFYTTVNGSNFTTPQLGLCQTDATGECTDGFWGGSTYVDMPTNGTATFTVFIAGTTSMPSGTTGRIGVWAEDTTGYNYGYVAINVVME
jgi:hypothetical protein